MKKNFNLPEKSFLLSLPQNETEVLEGDPFQFVVGDEATLHAADTSKLANYNMTYDEISEGVMYVFKVDCAHIRPCKNNERGSWMVGCPTKADLAETAPFCPRIAQRAYFFAPQDAISTKLMAASTSSSACGTPGGKRTSQRRKKMHFVVKKRIFWLADVPQCNIRVAVITIDKTVLNARHEAAMLRVLDQMHEMGFTDDKRNRRALAKHNGDINAAIQDLI